MRDRCRREEVGELAVAMSVKEAPHYDPEAARKRFADAFAVEADAIGDEEKRGVVV